MVWTCSRSFGVGSVEVLTINLSLITVDNGMICVDGCLSAAYAFAYACNCALVAL